IAGIGRAHANEILLRARLSPFKASTDLADDDVERLAAAIRDDLTRALDLRERGKGDSDVYVVHNRLGEPCPQCGTPIARVDFEEHTIYYCPRCQTRGRRLTPYWGFKGRGWDDVAMASKRKTRRSR